MNLCYCSVNKPPHNETMSIFETLKSLFGKLLDFCKDLPDEIKKDISNTVAKSFEFLLRKYYQKYKSKQQNSENKNA